MSYIFIGLFLIISNLFFNIVIKLQEYYRTRLILEIFPSNMNLKLIN